MIASQSTAARATRRSRGFTLIEVLVVVAIIALLISILLPSLSAARAQARIVACGTNFKTLAAATMYYAQANRDEMPAGYLTDDVGKLKLKDGKTQVNGNPWEFLYPHVQKISMRKGQSIDPGNEYSIKVPAYTCPDDRMQHTTDQRPLLTPSGIKRVELGLSYMANLNLLYLKYPDATRGTWRLSNIKRASNVVTYGDGGDDGRNGAQGWVLADCKADFGINQCVFELRHKTGNNFGYLDSHVEFSKRNNRPNQYGLPPFPMAWVPNWSVSSDPTLANLGHSREIKYSEVMTKCEAGGC